MDESKEELKLDVAESISVRYGDVVINISAEEDGILEGKTNEQIMKFCADLLLKNTDENSLENLLDISISLSETLKKDYGWKDVEISQFMVMFRKRLYIKQIGEENPEIEKFNPFRVVEPSSDIQETVKEESKKEKIIDENKQISINIPVNKKNIKQNGETENTFSIIDKDKK